MTKKKDPMLDDEGNSDDPFDAPPPPFPAEPVPGGAVDRDETVNTYHVGPKGFVRQGVAYNHGEQVEMPVWEYDTHKENDCDIHTEPQPAPSADEGGTAH